MTKVDCGKGHIYDADKYPTCPYCENFRTVDFGGFSVEEGGKTIPGNMPGSQGNKAKPEYNTGAKQPYSQRSVTDDGKTLPPRGYETPVGAGPITIGVMKRELGIDPVVGWLVCIEGSEKGKDYHLYGRINTVGKNEDMDVCIHGDNSITGNIHVKIAYDPKTNNFYIVPGNASDNTYLNDEPIYSQKRLSAYDLIEMGSTKLLFIPLCGQQFSWYGGLNREGGDYAVF